MKFLSGIILIISLFLCIICIIWFAGSQPLFVTPDKVTSPDVDNSLLKAHVQQLSEVLPPRLGAEASLKPTIEWIEKALAPIGNSYRQTYTIEDEHFHNIVINFYPEVKHPPAEIIVVGAHYDTAHGYPGADDNASGVAALIALAKLLSANRDKLTHSVQLVFYTLEEPPYFRTDKMGSYIHASKLKEKEKKVKLMIALDMLGYFSDEGNSQDLPFPLMHWVYPTKGNFIAVVGDLGNMLATRKVKSYFKSATELPVFSFNAPKFITGIDFSDHLNFWHYDYPAVLITDTSFNRNKHYHTQQDTAEKLDYEKMAEVVKALYQTVIQLPK